MTELLPLSIGIGLAVGVLFTEMLGIASGGLIVPGYIALYLHKPWNIAATLVIAYVAFAAVRTLSSFMILYGRGWTDTLNEPAMGNPFFYRDSFML